MNIRPDPIELGVPAPVQPRTLVDTGLTNTMLRDILLKTVFRKSLETTREIASALCLTSGLTQQLVDQARDAGLMQATGTMHAGSSGEMGFQLTDQGKARAMDALSQSEYYGPMPVPLETYKMQVKAQSIKNIRMTRDLLTKSMGHLILPEGLLDQLGPAVGSGRSVLLYGPPGNGKSSIAEGIRAAMGDHIWIPHAIEYAGQVITLYDPIVHTPIVVDADVSELRKVNNRVDGRYILCQRPTVMTGGELSLDMLDLNYNPVARTYQASLQLKSSGGVSSWTTLAARPNRRRKSSTAGSFRWKWDTIFSHCSLAKSSRCPSIRLSYFRQISTRTRFSTWLPYVVFSSRF